MDLRAIRAQLGKTQAEVAEALGGEFSLVARFGKRSVRLRV
jgi:transcriptional regulator with XRE-family HTH domain